MSFCFMLSQNFQVVVVVLKEPDSTKILFVCSQKNTKDLQNIFQKCQKVSIWRVSSTSLLFCYTLPISNEQFL